MSSSSQIRARTITNEMLLELPEYFPQNVSPAKSERFDLGEDKRRWRNLYVDNIIATNGGNIDTNTVYTTPLEKELIFTGGVLTETRITLNYDTTTLQLINTGQTLAVDAYEVFKLIDYDVPLELDPTTPTLRLKYDTNTLQLIDGDTLSVKPAAAVGLVFIDPLNEEEDAEIRLKYNTDVFDLTPSGQLQIKNLGQDRVPFFKDASLTSTDNFFFVDDPPSTPFLQVPSIVLAGPSPVIDANDAALLINADFGMELAAYNNSMIFNDAGLLYSNVNTGNDDITTFVMDMSNQKYTSMSFTQASLEDRADFVISNNSLDVSDGYADLRITNSAAEGGLTNSCDAVMELKNDGANNSTMNLKAISGFGTCDLNLEATSALTSGITLTSTGAVASGVTLTSTGGGTGGINLTNSVAGIGGITLTNTAGAGGTIALVCNSALASNIVLQCAGLGDGDISLIASSATSADIRLFVASGAAPSGGIDIAVLGAAATGGIQVRTVGTGPINLSTAGSGGIGLACTGVGPINLTSSGLGGIGLTCNGAGPINLATQGVGGIGLVSDTTITLESQGSPVTGGIYVNSANIVLYSDNNANTGQQILLRTEYQNATVYVSEPVIGIINDGDLNNNMNANGTLDWSGAISELQVAGDSTILLSTNHGSISLRAESSIVFKTTTTLFGRGEFIFRTGALIVENSTDSSAPTNGAVVMNGGVGIQKSLHVNLGITTRDSLTIQSENAGNSGFQLIRLSIGAVSTTDLAFVQDRSTGLSEAGLVAYKPWMMAVRDSDDYLQFCVGETLSNVYSEKMLITSDTTFVRNDLQVDGTSFATEGFVTVSTLESTTYESGSIVTAGGVGIAKNLNVNGSLFVNQVIAVPVLDIKSTLTEDTAAVFMRLYVDTTTLVARIQDAATGLNEAGLVAFKPWMVAVADASDYFSVRVGPSASPGVYEERLRITTTTAEFFVDIETDGFIVSTNTTNSTSTTTGAITTAGGVGIAKDLYVGQEVYAAQGVFSGAVISNNSVAVISSLTNNAGAEFFSASINDSVVFQIVDSDGSTNPAGLVALEPWMVAVSNPAHYLSLCVGNTGGAYDERARLTTTTLELFVDVETDGFIVNSNSTNATSSTTGSITTAGGVGIAQDLYVGGSIYVSGGSVETGDQIFLQKAIFASPSPTTDRWYLQRDASQNLQVYNVAGTDVAIHFQATPKRVGVYNLSPAYTLDVTGTFGCSGVANLGSNLNVTGNITCTATTASTSISTGSVTTAGGMGVALNAFIGGALTLGIAIANDTGQSFSLFRTVSTNPVLECKDRKSTGGFQHEAGLFAFKPLMVCTETASHDIVFGTGRTVSGYTERVRIKQDFTEVKTKIKVAGDFPTSTGEYRSASGSNAVIVSQLANAVDNHSGTLTLLDNRETSVGGGGYGGSLVFAGPYDQLNVAFSRFYGAAGRIRGRTTTGSYGGSLLFEAVNAGDGNFKEYMSMAGGGELKIKNGGYLVVDSNQVDAARFINNSGTNHTYVYIEGAVGYQQALAFRDTTNRWLVYKPSSSTDLNFYCNALDTDAMSLKTSKIDFYFPAEITTTSTAVLTLTNNSNQCNLILKSPSLHQAALTFSEGSTMRWGIYRPGSSTDLRIFNYGGSGRDLVTLTQSNTITLNGTFTNQATGAATSTTAGPNVFTGGIACDNTSYFKKIVSPRLEIPFIQTSKLEERSGSSETYPASIIIPGAIIYVNTASRSDLLPTASNLKSNLESLYGTLNDNDHFEVIFNVASGYSLATNTGIFIENNGAGGTIISGYEGNLRLVIRLVNPSSPIFAVFLFKNP